MRLQFLIVLLVIGALGCETNPVEHVDDNNDELVDDGIDGQADEDILIKLQKIQGARVIEIPATGHFNRLFEIYLRQPVNHEDINGPSFLQKIYLGHVSEELPVVLETEGYARDNFLIRDLAPVMNSNQISVEHRYNGSSVPNPTNWQYLTIKQAADDIHRIVTLMKEIYTAGWVSSGRSKGGDTAIFHRRFYPEDVDATVAIVAPILFSDNDERIENYLNVVGDESCRNKVKEFQRNVLLKADSVATHIPGYIAWVNDNFNTRFTFSISHEDVVKYAAIDYPFEFWSSPDHNCSSIPGSNAVAEELYNHLVEVINLILFYSDYGVDFWQGWYYQAQTEIGNFKINTEHIDDLIGDLQDVGSIYDFGRELVFNPLSMQDIDNWIKSEGDRIIFVYGEKDPWTAAQFELGSGDVIKIINSGTKHETTLYDLNSSDQAVLTTKLSSWLNYNNIQFPL